VDVEINDYGPDRGLHPDRVIDLDKVAFQKISSLGAGIINVRVEPLYVAEDSGSVLGVSVSKATSEPEIKAKAAVVINENSREILWQKNATEVLPLASLTKMVAVKVFLDTRPTLSRAVTYSVKDEEYNYQYCSKWESARVTLNDGDTVTVEDLIYSALVGSANNAVETLARVSGLSRNDFIQQMNKSVAAWGAESTGFVEPTGLSPDNVSSAADYAIITTEVFKHPIIQKASTMQSYSFTTINTLKDHTIRNTNQWIKNGVSGIFAPASIVGTKTGYLHEAGYCLMTRIKDGDDYLIAVTLGADSRDQSFSETEALLKYGLKKIAD